MIKREKPAADTTAVNLDVNLDLIEKNPSKLKWAVMITAPIALFIISLFLGRYHITPLEVVGIFGQKLTQFLNLPVSVPTFWSDTAETVLIKVRLPRAIIDRKSVV